MPNAHRGIRNQGLSNASYQSPRDSPTRAVPKSANSTHTATATNNGPILSERTSDLPHPTQTRLYFPAWCACGTPGVEQVLRDRPFCHFLSLCRVCWPALLRCDGRWYLDAVLGRDLHDRPSVWLVLKGGHPAFVAVHRRAHLIEKALVQAPRCLGCQQTAHVLAHVLVGVQGAPGDAEKGASARPDDPLAAKELVLPFEHVEGLVLAVVDVGRRPFPRLRGDLEERVRPPGLIAGYLARHQLAENP